MTDRVVLFIDYQNVYKGARTAFFSNLDSAPYTDGQIDPIALGNLICSRPPPGGERVLREVRVYTGRPDASKQPKTYGPHMRQCAAWERAGVTVRPRTLRYPRDWPMEKAQEKGIDVLLAVDFVTMAIDDAFDVGVLFSTDTDLRPAIEYVTAKFDPIPRGEVAAWSSPTSRGRLSVRARRPVWCHYLDHDDYVSVADPTDYNLA